MFEITTEAHGRKSQTTKTKVRTMPLITSEITVINQQEVTTALTLRYTPTPFPSSYFDTYRLDIFRKKNLKLEMGKTVINLFMTKSEKCFLPYFKA